MRTVFMIGVVLLGTLSTEAGRNKYHIKPGKYENKTNQFNVYRKLKKKKKLGNLTKADSSKYGELATWLASKTVTVSPQPNRHYDDELKSNMKKMEQNSR